MVDQLKLDDLQSYGDLLVPRHLHQAPLAEQRLSGRKLIEAGAVLAVDGVSIDVKTVDVSAGGLCIRAARQLAVGKECLLSFPLTAGGVERHITADVHVIYCFYTVEQDFKVGVEFLNIAPAVADDISQFVAA